MGDLHYIVCSGLLKSPAPIPPEPKTFIGGWELYDKDDADLWNLCSRMFLRDADLQHGDLMDAAVVHPWISYAEASAVVRSGYAFAEILRLWLITLSLMQQADGT